MQTALSQYAHISPYSTRISAGEKHVPGVCVCVCVWCFEFRISNALNVDSLKRSMSACECDTALIDYVENGVGLVHGWVYAGWWSYVRFFYFYYRTRYVANTVPCISPCNGRACKLILEGNILCSFNYTRCGALNLPVCCFARPSVRRFLRRARAASPVPASAPWWAWQIPANKKCRCISNINNCVIV